MEQALARAGGDKRDQGRDAARAVLRMSSCVRDGGLRVAQPAADHSGAALATRIDRRLFRYGMLANGAGAVVVLLFLFYIGPSRLTDAEVDGVISRSVPGFVVFLAFALPFGRYWAARSPFRPIAAWLRSERPATIDEQKAVLRYPLVWAERSMVIWATGALLFGAINSTLGFVNTLGVTAMVALGGVASCALQYLVVERIIRPITARALRGGAPPENPAPGVSGRLTMAWTLATGTFLLGIIGLALAYLVDKSIDETRILVAIVVLAVNAIFGGLMAMVIASRSVAEPLAHVSQALERVQRGDLDTRVEVDDGSEVGLVQAGFNRMTEGLAERERIREAFGTYVDADVAEHVLREGTALEGEEVEVTAMFVDIRDFTGFAEREAAPVVVAALNRLFEEIVPVVHSHGGAHRQVRRRRLPGGVRGAAAPGRPRRPGTRGGNRDRPPGRAPSSSTSASGSTPEPWSRETSAAAAATTSASWATQSTSRRASRPPRAKPAT